MPIGIDLGTTYCAVAVFRPSGRPEILPNREGEDITPSVVLFQSFEGTDEPMVGSMAKHAAATAPYDVVQFVKRHIGNPAWRFDSSSGAVYSAEEVSAVILRRLKEDAERALNHPVTDAVITVPAYFDDARRKATRDAGRIAGLNVLRVLNEPTAAALAFGLDSAAEGSVLVYDLGGGTFDVTLLRINDDEFDVLATDGDRNLGGFDFDNRLMQHVAKEVLSQGGPDLLDDDFALASLREKVEIAKRSLTTVATATVYIGAGERSFAVRVTRTQFEQLTFDLLRRTEDLTDSVLEDAGFTWDVVDHLVLVGGSTRMPMVRELMEKRAGRPAERSVHPDQAVALGAAMQAALGFDDHDDAQFGTDEPDGADGFDDGTAGPGRGGGVPPLPVLGAATMRRVSDVTSHSLGTISRKGPANERVNHIIIPRNASIPAQASQVFNTSSDGQPDVYIQVTEGEDTDPQYVTIVGHKVIPLPPYPRGARIEVVYAYDIDQTVVIEVIDGTTGSSLGQFEVDRTANLTDEQIDEARRRNNGFDIQ